MASTFKDEGSRLERYDGSMPATYRKWRRKAEIMLMALPTTYPKEKWGARLMEYVGGEAEEVVETISMEKVTKEDGYTLVFAALDDKYKELDKDALHKHRTEYFYGVTIKSGETYRNLVVRLETAYRRLQEHKVELPEEVSKAVTNIFPQGVAKGTSGRTKEVFEASVNEEDYQDETADEVDEVYQAVADQVQSNPEYDDEDTLDVFETYKEARRQVQQRKMGRGYRPTSQRPEWTLTGTVKGRIEQLKQRTKCHLCHERGHWKKECPKRKNSGPTTKDAMIAEGPTDGWKDLGQEHFIDEDKIGELEVFLAERGDQVDVVIAPTGESVNDDGEMRGGFKKGKLVENRKRPNEHGKTQNLNDAEGSGDTPMVSEEVVRTPIVDRLLQDLSSELQEQTDAVLGASILDASSDHSEDEPEGLVSGLTGAKIFNVGKYEKMKKVPTTFSSAYINDKKYVAWVRKFIKDQENKGAKATSHPTMAMFRLYIELRDQQKTKRLRNATLPVRVPRTRTEDHGYGGGNARTMQAPMVATPKTRTRPTRPSTPLRMAPDSEWLVMQTEESSPNPEEQPRRLLRQQIEATTHELEFLEEQQEL
ncbi:unnamed protein product [Symbiodinium sp. CCMP2592]|nr:unnamed protein product [Symbiodinium sp. CCMP2592]